jgi:DNA polymerase-1
MKRKPIMLDYETHAIGPRPFEYPPKPVGLAVFDPEGEYEYAYHAFGHDIENNTTFDAVKELLTKIWNSDREICFHNSMFDHEVTVHHFGLPFLPSHRVHDTLTMAFLHDCHAESLSLKALAVAWLNDKPTERDALFEWLVANVPEVKKKPKQAGAFICRGPGNLVGEYAMADVRMTAKLFDHCSGILETQADAYAREMALQPVLLENSRLGVRVDREGMQKALEIAQGDVATCDTWLATFFGQDGINYSSGKQLAEAIVKKGCWNQEASWPTTDKGTPKTDKETLATILNDKSLIAVLRYRETLQKLMGTYLEPWLAQSASSGRIYTDWNAVRGELGGTRTGRLSGRPSLQTMPTRYPLTDLPPDLVVAGFPMIREFILPDEGHKIISSDFNAQELRIFAHFEDGQLAEQYRKDPRADLHQFAADLMTNASGKPVSRTYSKGLSFAILYGAGTNKISEMLEIDKSLAKELVDIYQTAVATGLKPMNDDMRSRYARRAPIKTLGGRLVRGEPAKVIMGRLRQFDYKMLNLLIQGSAADMAKAAMVLFAKRAPVETPGARLLLSMHDELVISAPAEIAKESAKLLEECMCTALQLDLPLMADAVIGDTYQEVK